MIDTVLCDRPAPGVARLRINRPDKRNAIDHGVRQVMIDQLALLSADGETRALVLGGVDGIFSAGGDLPSMAGLDETGARERMQHIHSLCRKITSAPFPVVSAIESVAAGGAVGMALLGDHIVVETGAKVLFPFLALGLAPDWGQLYTLPRRVGLPASRRLFLSGKSLDAVEAYSIGFADELAEAGGAMEAAVSAASRLAALPTDAFLRTRARLNGPAGALDAELQREEDDQAVCLVGAEFAEGYAAFAQKRRPDFFGIMLYG